MRMPAIVALTFGVLFTCFALPAKAQQGPDVDGNELQIWTGGGHGTNGRTQHTSLWNLGFRYGWVLTEPHGPGFLRGRFEYAVDAVPVYVIVQPTNTVYGGAIDPVGLIWNLDTHGRVVPYFELGGGALFTSAQVPSGTSQVNFTTNGAFGLRFLRKRATWSADLRFMHISNASIAALNPGINTLQLRVGVGWFTRGRH